MWKEELLTEIRADEVELDNLKVQTQAYKPIAGKIIRRRCLWFDLF